MHSELELAIIRQQCLIIHYKNGNDMATKIVTITPHDIVTRSHKKGQPNGEFLLAVDTRGELVEIRLDFIQSYLAC
jgi:transcriptional antiterminator Rof (Rho-off)